MAAPKRLNERRSRDALDEAVTRCAEQTTQIREGQAYAPAVVFEIFSKQLGVDAAAFRDLIGRIRADVTFQVKQGVPLAAAIDSVVSGALLAGFNLHDVHEQIKRRTDV